MEETKYFDPPEDRDQHEDLQKEIFNRTEKVLDDVLGVLWKCTDCRRVFKKRNRFGRHVETHLEGFVHKCKHCDKTHKTSGSLKKHIARFHKSGPSK